MVTLADDLLELFESRAPDGTRVFSSAEVSGAVVYFVFACGLDPAVLPRRLRAGFDEVLLSAGVTEEMSGAEIAERVRRRFAEHPPAPRLLGAISAILALRERRSDQLASRSIGGGTAARRPAPAVAGASSWLRLQLSR